MVKNKNACDCFVLFWSGPCLSDTQPSHSGHSFIIQFDAPFCFRLNSMQQFYFCDPFCSQRPQSRRSFQRASDHSSGKANIVLRAGSTEMCVLSTLRNHSMGRGDYLETREQRAPGRVTEVNKHMNAPIPFVDVRLQGQWEDTKICMCREDLLKEQRGGMRLRFMNNERSVGHWSNVYAATPEQLTSLTNPNDVHVCVLVGPIDHFGPMAGMFPVGCLVWMAPDLSLPGEVSFSWLDFYPAEQHRGEAPSSTRNHRAAPRHVKPCNFGKAAPRHVTSRRGSYHSTRNHMVSPASLRAASAAVDSSRCSVGERQTALLDKSETKPQDEGACGLEPDSECVICMEYEAAYAWVDCEHFRPLLCSGCVRLSWNAGIQTSCVMCRKVSKLAAYGGSTPS